MARLLPLVVGALLVVSLAGMVGLSGLGGLPGVADGPSVALASPGDGATPMAEGMADPSGESLATGTLEEEFDRTTFRITVLEDGDATWTMTHERVLETDEDVEHFETWAEEFEREETDLFRDFQAQAEGLVGAGEEHTERSMAATDFERAASVELRPEEIGVVTLSFHWSGFAPVEDGTVTVGDVFAGGLYISEGQTLIVEPGEGIVVTSVAPEPDVDGTTTGSDRLIWEGERQFADGQPTVVLEERGATDGIGGIGAIVPGLGSWLGPLALFAIAVAIVVGAAWHRVGRPLGPLADIDLRSGSTESADAAGAGPDPIPDEELLSDEDRVVRLIRENGGRMKQVKIVEETDWSKSKVSMLLSEMEDEGTISKLRVGRENIISLEGYEPDAARSPFEDRE